MVCRWGIGVHDSVGQVDAVDQNLKGGERSGFREDQLKAEGVVLGDFEGGFDGGIS